MTEARPGGRWDGNQRLLSDDDCVVRHWETLDPGEVVHLRRVVLGQLTGLRPSVTAQEAADTLDMLGVFPGREAWPVAQDDWIEKHHTPAVVSEQCTRHEHGGVTAGLEEL